MCSNCLALTKLTRLLLIVTCDQVVLLFVFSLACVAGVKRGRGRGNFCARERVGRAWSRALIPYPFLSNACHVGHAPPKKKRENALSQVIVIMNGCLCKPLRNREEERDITKSKICKIMRLVGIFILVLSSAQRGFLLRVPPLLENQHFQIPVRPGIR